MWRQVERFHSGAGWMNEVGRWESAGPAARTHAGVPGASGVDRRTGWSEGRPPRVAGLSLDVTALVKEALSAAHRYATDPVAADAARLRFLQPCNVRNEFRGG